MAKGAEPGSPTERRLVMKDAPKQ